jgi:hypothetical protein
MAEMILPSKLVPEQITVTFEFLDELDWGDTIVSAEVICTVAIGVDPNPEFVLRQDTGVFDTYVTQKVRNGLPGVFYRLVCLATTVGGKVLEKKSVLAVLPAVAAVPDLFGVAYTSWPYPIDRTESITSNATWHSGLIEQIVVYEPVESIQSSAIWLAGVIAVAPEYFARKDDIQSNAVWLTGFEETSIPYNLRQDDIQSSCEWRTGEELTGIGYTFRSDDITSSCAWIAGSSP